MPTKKPKTPKPPKKSNLSEEDYQTILAFQNGRCICGFTPKERRLATDHRHRDGFIRGLLCPLCNRIIGILHDNAAKLRAMADYLDNPTAPLALGREVYGEPGHWAPEKVMPKLTNENADEAMQLFPGKKS